MTQHKQINVAVIIMAKTPQPGTVKTRLCPPLLPWEAASLYRCFMLDTIDTVRRLKAIQPVLAYTPAGGRAFFADVAPDFILILQEGNDLGAKMTSCFVQLFARGYTAIVLIGSDLPTLPLSHLQLASALITRPHIDVVLGPSEDGGYYLIGLRRLHRELFESMTWSTDQVFAETVRRAHAKGLRIARVPSWYDIDSAADLERLQTATEQTQAHLLGHTHRFLINRFGEATRYCI